MFPVLQPSMFDVDSKADNHSSSPSNVNGRKLSQDHYFKNEAAISAGPSAPFYHLHSRMRFYLSSYRGHRYFRRSMIILWILAVVISVSANWLAWTGNSLMESLAIATTTPVDICFITAQYASSPENLDDLVNLRVEAPQFFNDRNSDKYHFFAFTNHRDWIEKKEIAKPKKDKKASTQDNGWAILVQEFPPQTFQRFITQSRWPKFQGFRHEKIQQTCDVVFYMDGTVRPIGSPWKFQTEARRILDSSVQMTQELHPHAHEDGGGIAGEMNRCRVKKKDIEANLNATLAWFHAQPDFSNDCVMYQNTFFGYGVNSPSFKAAADFAWGHFSLEKDSWRDQPLWCYTLHHFGIVPLIIPNNLFQYQGERRPANKHTYGEEAATNAQKFYQTNGGKPNNTATAASGGNKGTSKQEAITASQK